VIYVGRFAPSPTGPLHFGSLLTAVASFLHAKQAGGEWRVRVEDIDPPREVPGAAADILRTLEAFDLPWDGPIVYQSRRHDVYAAAAARLLDAGLAFHCSCSRADVRAANPGDSARYPGTCRARAVHERATAIRVRVDAGQERFVDGLQGGVERELADSTGDYMIWRRDALPAYHLAVVVDDAEQGITTIVRGVDLLESTPVHLHLQRTLGLPAPSYWHTPVVVNPLGYKLSKQTGAAAVGRVAPSETAARVLELLGAQPPGELRGAPPHRLWSWALEHWRADSLRGVREIPLGASAKID
jgi:glutamyl-Q tRNA(Asp) synthetase